MRPLLALLALALLSGCSSGMMPVYQTIVGESGELTETIAGYTKEASVFKEESIAKTLRNRDDRHAEMYAISGFKMTFAMQEVSPGVMALLPKDISYREEPDFDQALPTEPSKHPVWSTANSLFSTIAKYGLIGFGISELSGVLQAGYDKAGNTFNGDANLDSSFNAAGTSQEWTAGSSALPGLSGDLPPGCSGLESYLAGNCGEIIE